MSAAHAKEAAEKWIADTGLPEDLRGRVVQIAVFTTEEACRFFYPRRALKWQQQVNTYISRTVIRRKGRIARLELTIEGYKSYFEAAGLKDSEPARREYADSFHRLLQE